MNITEDYVSFEIAKLLKEKGFDDFTCHSYYYKNGDIEDETRYNGDFGRPTLQMAMKWLREVHNILIVINRHSTGYGWEIEDNTTGQPKGIGECNSHEQACEAAIKYCLEHLI